MSIDIHVRDYYVPLVNGVAGMDQVRRLRDYVAVGIYVSPAPNELPEAGINNLRELTEYVGYAWVPAIEAWQRAHLGARVTELHFRFGAREAAIMKVTWAGGGLKSQYRVCLTTEGATHTINIID